MATTHKFSKIPQDENKSKINLTQKTLDSSKISFPFGIPPSPESAAVRIIKNIGKFSLQYAIIQWAAFSITFGYNLNFVSVMESLIPMGGVIITYYRLIRAISTSVVFHKRIERRFLLLVLFVELFFVFLVTAVLIIVTITGEDSKPVTIAATIFATIVILLHAVLTKREDVFGNEKAGEVVYVVKEKGTIGDLGDAQPHEKGTIGDQGDAQPQDLV